MIDDENIFDAALKRLKKKLYELTDDRTLRCAIEDYLDFFDTYVGTYLYDSFEELMCNTDHQLIMDASIIDNCVLDELDELIQWTSELPQMARNVYVDPILRADVYLDFTGLMRKAYRERLDEVCSNLMFDMTDKVRELRNQRWGDNEILTALYIDVRKWMDDPESQEEPWLTAFDIIHERLQLYNGKSDLFQFVERTGFDNRLDSEVNKRALDMLITWYWEDQQAEVALEDVMPNIQVQLIEAQSNYISYELMKLLKDNAHTYGREADRYVAAKGMPVEQDIDIDDLHFASPPYLIPAKLIANDASLSMLFDAEPWFRDAHIISLRMLFRGDMDLVQGYIVDHCAGQEGYLPLRNVLDRIRQRGVTWSLMVDTEAAGKWLRKFRPEMYDRIRTYITDDPPTATDIDIEDLLFGALSPDAQSCALSPDTRSSLPRVRQSPRGKEQLPRVGQSPRGKPHPPINFGAAYQPKYELTDETIEVDGHTLHRIRALRHLTDVTKGELGGFVESENNLSHKGDCWVYRNAKIYDNAKVRSDARLYDNAHVRDTAWVSGYAQVYGDAQVYGNARVKGNTQVFGDAHVYEYAYIHGDAYIYDNAHVSGNARVHGNARVYGNARVSGNAKVYGYAQVSDHAEVCGNAEIVGITNVKGYAYMNGGKHTEGTLNETAHPPPPPVATDIDIENLIFSAFAR